MQPRRTVRPKEGYHLLDDHKGPRLLLAKQLYHHIAPEVRKPDSEAVAIEVHDHIEDIISGGSIPTDWQEGYIINLYKGKREL